MEIKISFGLAVNIILWLLGVALNTKGYDIKFYVLTDKSHTWIAIEFQKSKNHDVFSNKSWGCHHTYITLNQKITHQLSNTNINSIQIIKKKIQSSELLLAHLSLGNQCSCLAHLVSSSSLSHFHSPAAKKKN